MKEFVTIARLDTQTTDENNETFRRETVSHEFLFLSLSKPQFEELNMTFR